MIIIVIVAHNNSTGRGPGGAPTRITITTVSFHNFKSQNFKLSVSNPESKYGAYLSVLSQISIARVYAEFAFAA